MPNLRRALCLLIGVLFGVPAYAQASDICLVSKEFRGKVRTVLIYHGTAMPGTSTPRGALHLWERIDISRDRHTVTITQYSSDGPSVLPLFNLWPTTVCEFDDEGKLVKKRVKLNGLTTHTTVETTYDARGRPLKEQSRSRNPEFTYDVIYEYAGNATTQRFSRGTAKTTITELDAAGRTTREITRDAINDVELSSVEYRYGPDTIEVLGRENGTTWRMMRRIDPMGNTIEGVSRDSRHTATFEYDVHGNWIRRVQSVSFGPSSSSPSRDLTVREISYWP